MRTTAQRALIVATACLGLAACQPLEEDELEEESSDLEVSPAALKLKATKMVPASPETTSSLGIVAWQVSRDKEEIMIAGFDKRGQRALVNRTQIEKGGLSGRITFRNERKPLAYRTFDSEVKLRVSDRRYPRLLEVLRHIRRDFAPEAQSAKFSYEDCFYCAALGVGCAGSTAVCAAAATPTLGAAVVGCAGVVVSVCATTGFECAQCITGAGSEPNVTVTVEVGEPTYVCMRLDPCWCERHPNECFSPGKNESN